MEDTTAAEEKTVSLTILRTAGLVEPGFFQAVAEVVRRYNLTVYLSTAQNIRLLDVRESDRDAIMKELAAKGARFKGTVKFPLARVCVSRPHCKLGKFDTFALARRISEHFEGWEKIKPKIKIAISGCTAACSGPLTTDIGIVGTPVGLDVYAGGKLGALPKVGRRILRRADQDRVIAVIEELVTYHYNQPGKKLRMFKLINNEDFPYPHAV